MIPPYLFDDLQSDRLYKTMYKTCKDFNRFLDDTQWISVVLRGLLLERDKDTGEVTDVDALEFLHPFLSRWTPLYQKKVVACLKRLEAHYQFHPPDMTSMITLTGIHDSPRWKKTHGLGYMDWLDNFHIALPKNRQILYKYEGKIPYIRFIEPHPESGFAHAHYLVFRGLQGRTISNLTNHWNKTLGMGSMKRGLKVEVREPNDFSEIQSLIAYPLAYLAPTFIDTVNEWTVQDLIFNASLWAHRPRLRTFQPSRDLSLIMAYQKPENLDYIHVETLLREKGVIAEDIPLNRGKYYEMNKKFWKQHVVLPSDETG